MKLSRLCGKLVRVLAASMFLVSSGSTQTASASAQEKAPAPRWQLGGELDAMPYIMGGYYGSGFMARDGWKLRYVVARSNTPSFLVTEGFKDKRTDAYALLADRFIGPQRHQLAGLWVGGGAEYWRNRIRADDSPLYASYQNYMLTAGGGYVWKLSRHVYLNPWAAGHVVAANRRVIPISGKTYTQPVFTPEGSVKLGFTF